MLETFDIFVFLLQAYIPQNNMLYRMNCLAFFRSSVIVIVRFLFVCSLPTVYW